MFATPATQRLDDLKATVLDVKHRSYISCSKDMLDNDLITGNSPLVRAVLNQGWFEADRYFYAIREGRDCTDFAGKSWDGSDLRYVKQYLDVYSIHKDVQPVRAPPVARAPVAPLPGSGWTEQAMLCAWACGGFVLACLGVACLVWVVAMGWGVVGAALRSEAPAQPATLLDRLGWCEQNVSSLRDGILALSAEIKGVAKDVENVSGEVRLVRSANNFSQTALARASRESITASERKVDAMIAKHAKAFQAKERDLAHESKLVVERVANDAAESLQRISETADRLASEQAELEEYQRGNTTLWSKEVASISGGMAPLKAGLKVARESLVSLEHQVADAKEKVQEGAVLLQRTEYGWKHLLWLTIAFFALLIASSKCIMGMWFVDAEKVEIDLLEGSHALRTNRKLAAMQAKIDLLEGKVKRLEHGSGGLASLWGASA